MYIITVHIVLFLPLHTAHNISKIKHLCLKRRSQEDLNWSTVLRYVNKKSEFKLGVSRWLVYIYHLVYCDLRNLFSKQRNDWKRCYSKIRLYILPFSVLNVTSNVIQRLATLLLELASSRARICPGSGGSSFLFEVADLGEVRKRRETVKARELKRDSNGIAKSSPQTVRRARARVSRQLKRWEPPCSRLWLSGQARESDRPILCL